MRVTLMSKDRSNRGKYFVLKEWNMAPPLNRASGQRGKFEAGPIACISIALTIGPRHMLNI